MGKWGKSRNLAFKGIEKEIEDSEDEDESEDDDEDLIFIIDEIIKLLQFKKKDKGKPHRKSNPLGIVRVKNPSSSAMSAKVLVI